jgi:molybdopterin synthase catalytic subunit
MHAPNPLAPPTTRVTTRVDDLPVPPAHTFDSPLHGAELCFRGVVRGLEAGQPIRGIRYTAYLPMARATLQALAEAAAADHPSALIHIHHRIGDVDAGEASLLLAVATPHSAEALALLESLLRRLKAEVPIWKQPLPIVDKQAAAAKPSTT